MEKNIYIKIFEFGNKNLDGFDYDKIIQDIVGLKDWEKLIIEENIRNAWYNKNYLGTSGFNSKESFFYCMNHGGGNYGLASGNKYIINSESFFNYLDYIELKEARKNSKDAQKNATIAIWIAIATFLVSSILSVIEIYLR